jgi:hypothetical protein
MPFLKKCTFTAQCLERECLLFSIIRPLFMPSQKISAPPLFREARYLAAPNLSRLDTTVVQQSKKKEGMTNQSTD